MTEFPKFVQINEEGPREGFQIEKGPISTARKVELIDALSETGVKFIQVTSFVHPRRVPGMADAEEVAKDFRRKPGVHYAALWLNAKGLERAMATKAFDIEGRVTLAASEKFSLSNHQRSASEDVQAQREMLKIYRDRAIALDHAYVMAAFGCNFEGDVAPQKVTALVRQMIDLAHEHGFSIRKLTLADTMAWATPISIKRMIALVRERFPSLHVTLHLHDTRGMGIANAYAGLESGIDSFDAAVAGLGGCPFAAHKGAAGNVCTEDLVFMLQEMGIETGIDLDKLIAAARLAEEIVGHPLPGSVMKGGALKALRIPRP